MALELKALSTISTNTDIVTIDTTLPWSATNTGGWGSPNLTIASITDAAIVIHLTDSTTLLPNNNNLKTFDSSTVPLAYPTLPNTIGVPFVLNGEDLGYGVNSKIPDGIIQIDYVVTDGVDTYTYAQYIMIDNTVQCCLSKDAINSGCGCNGSDRFSRGWSALNSARSAMLCPNITDAAKSLQVAISICNGCSGC